MDEITKVLKQEFDAEEGSFLLRLRGDLEWDRAAFTADACSLSDMRCSSEGRRQEAPQGASRPSRPRPAADPVLEQESEVLRRAAAYLSQANLPAK